MAVALEPATGIASETAARSVVGPVLIVLPPIAPQRVSRVVDTLLQAFEGSAAVVVTNQTSFTSLPQDSSGLRFVADPVPTQTSSGADWVLRAADFARAARLCRQHGAGSVLLLGPEADSVAPVTLHALASGLSQADVVSPRYRAPANAGLLQSGLLYPFSRALFGSSVRSPLPLDVALSRPAAERLGELAERHISQNRPEALLWPAVEAKLAGMQALEIDGGTRMQPQPEGELNHPFAQCVGSLFAEAETNAARWQTLRTASGAVLPASWEPAPAPSMASSAAHLVQAFQLGCSTLWDLWSLVMPPQSLESLRRLSFAAPADFVLAPSLWARIVYDFLLAHRLRTIPRRHLLGALTPLYLAWVASHLVRMEAGVDAEQEVEALARSFEQARPYLVSRWRWPDRWNP